jgi:ribonuclease R
VREVEAPTAAGQTVFVEERSGERWRVECLGEALAVGDRIAFAPLSGSSDPTARARGRRGGVVGAREGAMLRLLEAPRSEWVCTLHDRDGRLRLVPFGGLEAPELSLRRRDAGDARDGDRVVVVEVTGKPRRPRRAAGATPRRRALAVRVAEVLGPAGSPQADHRALVWKHRLTTEFPRRARLEAAAVEEAIPPAELARRLDLRHLPFITIDPASARDHDDAVFAEERPPERLEPVRSGARPAAGPETRSARQPSSRRGWARRLWVAIADVSHFVSEGSALDSEARRRGNSVYFPDRAIPMLPEHLSAGVCSLRPEVDRLAMVVELRLTAEGGVADALFHEALIRSHARLAYEEAAVWLDQAAPRAADDEPVWGGSLRCLDRIAGQLLRRRREEGAIVLELPELAIEVDELGRPVDCAVRTRNRAHILIEEAMLAANRAVAAALDRAGRPTLHRVHLPPSPKKLAVLAALLERLGLAVGDEDELAEPRVLNRILEQVKGSPSEERVHTAALRSMSQARYELEPRGHFALHFEHYLHFTSPIRRYADLEVHRALKRRLADRAESARADRERRERGARLAVWLSGRERLAIEVERDAASLACCALLRGREGTRFAARVVATSEFGLFVRLESPAASGLVPMRTLPGVWRHEPDEELLIGPRSGARIGVGDEIEVCLLEVDSDRGRLAFSLEQGARAEREGARPERRGRDRASRSGRRERRPRSS